MSTLGERIRMVRKAQSPKMSQTVFAESLGATQKMQTTYESDTVPPDKTYQKLLCLIYHINPLWLETGEGEMAAAEASAPCNIDRSSMTSLRSPITNPLSKGLTSSPFEPSINFFSSHRKRGHSFSE